MNRSKETIGRSCCSLLLIFTAFLLRPHSVFGQSLQHLNSPQLGGMPGQPVLTGVVPWTNGVGVTWDGPAGYYQLFEKSTLTDPTWWAVGPRTNRSRRAWVAGAGASALFLLRGPGPQYVGSRAWREGRTSIT